MSARGDLAQLACDWGLGGIINAIDSIGKQHGALPSEAHEVGLSLHELLEYLGLNTGAADGASSVWREEP